MHGCSSLEMSIIQRTSHLSDTLARICSITHERFPKLAEQMISPIQARFLNFLIRLHKPSRILEIGTFTGYSAMAMLHECNADLVTIEKCAEHCQIASRFLPENSVINANAHEYLAATEAKFDFVFVDAEKRGYKEYHKVIYRKCLNDGGLVVYDNVFMRDAVFSPKGLAADMADFIRHIDRHHPGSILLPAYDGMMILQKK